MISGFLIIAIRRVFLIASVASFLCSGLAFGQGADPGSLINRHEALQQQLREQEETLGRLNPSLVENLVSLSATAASLNLHSEASMALDRAIQIQRLHLGLFTDQQIPLYFSMLDSLMHAGDWGAVNMALDYLYWLVVNRQASEKEQRIAQMIRLSEFHLLSVAGDIVEQQSRHYRRAAELIYLALNTSEEVWGRHDPRRIDLHYSLVKQFYLQSAAIERSDATAYELRAVVPGSNWVRPRRVVQARLYQAGLRLLQDMRELLNESESASAEAVSMVDLYLADWHLLFNQERAGEAYRQAFLSLLEAGREPAELNRLFARPQILPIAKFHDTIKQALAASIETDPGGAELADQGQITSSLSFQEWFESMPAVPFPIIAPAMGQLVQVDYHDTWLRFRLNSLNKVSRWVKGTYESNISVVDEFNVLHTENDTEVDLDYLDDRLHSLRFRPRLEDGEVLPFEGVMRFRAIRNNTDSP
ncbi:MAG: hypothetical protein PsegKO_33520 [Pseudohongiellaceae bacterium]